MAYSQMELVLRYKKKYMLHSYKVNIEYFILIFGSLKVFIQ